MKIYFVRHGESEANVTQEFSNTATKHPLTASGRAQVEALADELRDVKFAAIYTSPLLRARETAEILSERLGVSYEVLDNLREHHAGELEGRRDPAGWQQYRDLIETWLVKQDTDARIPGGESYNELRARFIPLMTRLKEKHAATSDSIIVVGHGGLFHFMLPLFVSNVSFTFGMNHVLGNAACVVVEWNDEAWVCSQWGDERLGFEASPAT